MFHMIKYMCGCEKEMEFIQCNERKDTNVKCKPVQKILMKQSVNYCARHLVNPSAPDPFVRNQRA
ncbi:MAG: hypothetical protein M1832_001355 [Thelocarpon impressellum]|nr:MAG: hypothetical protein M1832_001355 [Thelocarpon impressellum]